MKDVPNASSERVSRSRMRCRTRGAGVALLVVLAAGACSAPSSSTAPDLPAHLDERAIDEAVRHVLSGNTQPLATFAHSAGWEGA